MWIWILYARRQSDVGIPESVMNLDSWRVYTSLNGVSWFVTTSELWQRRSFLPWIKFHLSGQNVIFQWWKSWKKGTYPKTNSDLDFYIDYHYVCIIDTSIVYIYIYINIPLRSGIPSPFLLWYRYVVLHRLVWSCMSRHCCGTCQSFAVPSSRDPSGKVTQKRPAS